MADMNNIGPYELRGELGRGAMARVWRAWDPHLRREVAIKEPLFDPRLSPEVLDEMGRRFVAEGVAAARLNHPNIVTIYSADVYDGRPAIVMELVEGATLSGLLESGPLEPATAVDALDQLLDAAAYAHSMGVVHRDIKPDNVFVGADGRVRLADFGIARVEDADATRATVAGAVLGTPGYMSPEQIRGDAVDARSDLFSIGVVAYEMLSGKNPFGAGEGADVTTLVYRVVNEPAPELPEPAASALPPSVAPAIMAALAKDPAERPQTADEFKAMLHGGAIPATASVAGSSLGAAAAATPSRTTSRWLPYVLVGVVGVAVIAFVLVSALGGGGGGAAPASGGSNATATSSTAATAYLAAYEGNVAIFKDDSSTPYEVTDVLISDLTPEDAVELGARIQVSSLDEARTKVQAYRDTIKKGKQGTSTAASNEPVGPPVFTTVEASSILDPSFGYTYEPELTLDNNPDSSWQEGVDGPGIGEWVRYSSSTPQRLKAVLVKGGVNSKESLYYRNNRPSKISVITDEGVFGPFAITDSYDHWERLELGKDVITSSVTLRIDDVYRYEPEGGKPTYNDTSISDVEFE